MRDDLPGDERDPLRAARGFMIAAAISAVLWAVIVLLAIWIKHI